MLDYRMDTLLATCKHMNFTKAAEELCITQPAVSQHIRFLEKNYGIKIFEYQGKKMFLTEAGERLYQNAITMKHDTLHLMESLRNRKDKKRKIVFGATLSIGEFAMAKHLQNYLVTYPHAEVKMNMGNTSALLEKLKMNKIDFAFIEGNFEKKLYDYKAISQERFIPVCAGTYTFPKKVETIFDLLTERIIVREPGSGTREILKNYLEINNLNISEFKNVLEIGGMNAIKLLVEAGCGITFLYEAVVKKELNQGILTEIPIKDFHVLHDFFLVWNKGSVFAEEYQNIAREMIGNNL